MNDPYVPAVVAGAGQYSAAFLQAVDWCLQPLAKDRPQNADELLAVLDETSTRTSDNTDATVIQNNNGNLAARMQADLSRSVTKVASAKPDASANTTIAAPKKSRVGLIVAVSLLLALLAATPFAWRYWNESSQLQQAIAAYEDNDYNGAYERFVALAGKKKIRLRNSMSARFIALVSGGLQIRSAPKNGLIWRSPTASSKPCRPVPTPVIRRCRVIWA
ncbi:MAG: hypothetical protein R3F38_03420 [Gammaproteobacteria bacterium]